MTQEAFGRHVGLDQGSVSRLERGRLSGIRLIRLMPVLVELGMIRRPSASTEHEPGPAPERNATPSSPP